MTLGASYSIQTSQDTPHHKNEKVADIKFKKNKKVIEQSLCTWAMTGLPASANATRLGGSDTTPFGDSRPEWVLGSFATLLSGALSVISSPFCSP